MNSKDIAAWNGYIDANNFEPQTGTQFQRWVAHSIYRDNISYNKAYKIFDKYTGKGKISIGQHQLPPRPQSAKASNYNHRQPQWNGNYIQSNNNNNNIPQQQINNHNQIHSLQSNQRQNNVLFQNYNNTFNQQQHYYNNNNFNNQRSRTQSAYNHNNNNNNNNPNPLNISHERQRSKTVTNIQNNNSNNSNSENNNSNKNVTFKKLEPVPLQIASNHIVANSLSPMEAINIIPKDDFTLFLIEHDIRDLKRKLKNNKIDLKHLISLEITDLNDLCIALQLSAPEKIRFKHAIKELHKSNKTQSVHSNSPPINKNNINNNIKNQPQSAPSFDNPNHYQDMYNEMSNFNAQNKHNNNGHFHTQTMPLQLQQQQHIHTNTQNNQFGLMQSEAINYHISPAVAAIADDGFPNVPDQKLQMNYGFSDDNNVYNNGHHNHNHAYTTFATGTIQMHHNHNHTKQVQFANIQNEDHHDPYGFVPPAPPNRKRNHTVSHTNIYNNNNKPNISINSSAVKIKKHRQQRRNSISTPCSPYNTWREWHNQWKTLVKESAENKDEMYEQSFSKCSSMKTCLCIKRIVFATRFYDKFKNKEMDLHEIIEAMSLKQYSILELLNDHFHILQFHKNKDKHFDFIFKQIAKIKKCAVNKCSMMKRNVLSKYNDYVLFYRGLDNIDDIISIQILDKLHCSYFHCYDLFRFTKQENNKLKDISENNINDLLHNKYYKTINKFMKIKHMNLKSIKGLDYHKGDGNLPKYNTDFINKNKNKNIFGYKYIYDNKNKNEEKKSDDIIFIKSKYKNIKNEMLNNELINFAKKDWDLILRKCEKYYFRTNKIKNFMKLSHKISKNNIESMICLYIFVNFEYFTKIFTSTYFKKELKNHCKFVCFAKCLNNTINKYGIFMKNNYHFYHGIIHTNTNNINNIELNNIDIQFQCPLLTTSRFEVINNYQQYANQNETVNGIILNLNNSNNNYGLDTKFIDSTCFKNMESEQQQIFYNNNNVYFNIVSIISIKIESNWFIYLQAMNTLKLILLSKEISFALTNEEYKAIIHLIQSIILPNNNNNNPIDNKHFISLLFNNFCNKQCDLNINMKQIEQIFSKNSYLSNFFISTVDIENKIYSINIENLQKIFPNINSLKLLSHYLNKKILSNLLYLYSMKNAKIIQYIEINDILLESNQNLNDSINQFENKFKKIGFKLQINAQNTITLYNANQNNNNNKNKNKLTNKLTRIFSNKINVSK